MTFICDLKQKISARKKRGGGGTFTWYCVWPTDVLLHLKAPITVDGWYSLVECSPESQANRISLCNCRLVSLAEKKKDAFLFPHIFYLCHA